MMEKEHSNLHLTKVEGKQERNGGNLGMDQYPFKGGGGVGSNTPSFFMPLGNWDKVRLGGPMGSSPDVTLTYWFKQIYSII